MHRRDFLSSAAAVALSGAAREPARATAAEFDPVEQSFAALQAALTAGKVSSEALVDAYLLRIARYDAHGPEHHAVLAINPDARLIARNLDAERRVGKLRGPLHGLPILVKDNIETQDPVSTTAGSYALANSRRPDAPLIARLRAAGGIVLGKANMSEWANFRSTRSSSGWSAVGGQARNAYARDRSPAGSSAGSAVAAAASFCAGAIGTETNGSILSPASLNGLVGMKPTVGLVSGRGVVPISPRQDTAGSLCRTVSDAAALIKVIAERPLGFGAYGGDLEDFRLRGVRIGVMPLPKNVHPGAAQLYARARDAFAGEGAVMIDMQALSEQPDDPEFEALLYEFKASINEYLATLDASQVEARSLADLITFNRTHADQELIIFGQELFEMAQSRGTLTEPAYRKALAALRRTDPLPSLLGRDGAELLMAPSKGPAELIDALWGDRRSGSGPQIASAAAVGGYPSLTVPAGLVAGLPVGVTLVTYRNQDGLLLQAARAFERATGARVPPRLAG
jgi:amidase